MFNVVYNRLSIIIYYSNGDIDLENKILKQICFKCYGSEDIYLKFHKNWMKNNVDRSTLKDNDFLFLVVVTLNHRTMKCDLFRAHTLVLNTCVKLHKKIDNQ